MLSPRVRFVSHPYAYVADKLDGFDAADLDDWGHTMWFDAGELDFNSGQEVCASRGLDGQYVQRQGPVYSPPDPSACATTQSMSGGTMWLAYCDVRND